jgi:hypothetical protein
MGIAQQGKVCFAPLRARPARRSFLASMLADVGKRRSVGIQPLMPHPAWHAQRVGANLASGFAGSVSPHSECRCEAVWYSPQWAEVKLLSHICEQMGKEEEASKA